MDLRKGRKECASRGRAFLVGWHLPSLACDEGGTRRLEGRGEGVSCGDSLPSPQCLQLSCSHKFVLQQFA